MTKYLFKTELGCDHHGPVVSMTLHTAIYRRTNLERLPMQVFCIYCKKATPIVRIHTNDAEELFLAKALGATK